MKAHQTMGFLSLYHFFKFGLIYDLNAEVSRFFELASGIFSGKDNTRFLRHRGRCLAAEAFDYSCSLVAFVICELAR